MDTLYYNKYLKYKTKYYYLKQLLGGGPEKISLITIRGLADKLTRKYRIIDNNDSARRILRYNYPKLIDKLNKCRENGGTSTIVAAVLYRDRIIKLPGCNTLDKFSRGKVSVGVHAEQKSLISFFGHNIYYSNTLKKWVALYKRAKYDIIVIRPKVNSDIDSTIETGLQMSSARPCTLCLNMLKDIGINKIYYSTGNDDEIVSENIVDMVSIFSSPEVRGLFFTEYNRRNVQEYYDELIIKNFPKKVKANNLRNFLLYATESFYKNYFGEYKVEINDKTNKFIIYNTKNEILISSEII